MAQHTKHNRDYEENFSHLLQRDSFQAVQSKNEKESINVISSSRKQSSRELGEWGERAARKFLRRAGYRIVLTNFVAPGGVRPDGRTISSEIDIIAYDESSLPAVLVFVEVKTRSDSEIAAPEAAVDRHKQRQIVRAARFYRRLMRITEEPFRFDVVSILARPGEDMVIELWRDFFRDK